MKASRVRAVLVGSFLGIGLMVGLAGEAMADYWLGEPNNFWEDWYPDTGEWADACSIPQVGGPSVNCYWKGGGSVVSCYNLAPSLCSAAGGSQHTAPGGSGPHCDLPSHQNPCEE